MDGISEKREKPSALQNKENMDLVGERVMKAARKIAQTIVGQIDLAKIVRDQSYLEDLKDNLFEPAIIKYARREKLIIQAYFEMPPEVTPQLGPEDEVLGVVLADTHKKGNFRRHELVKVKDFHPNNPYMKWFYEPVKRGVGVWSDVYFDPYINVDIITYSLPVYLGNKLLGVVGLDLDYGDFRRLMGP